MPTINAIIEELKNVPVNRLEDLYSIIISFQEDRGESGARVEEILSFAGAFSDMGGKDYGEFTEHTKQTRRELFDRDFDT